MNQIKETKLRLHEPLYRRLMQAAYKKHVPLNSEMRARLQASIDQDNPGERAVEMLAQNINAVSPERTVVPPPSDDSKKVAALQAELAQLRAIISSRQPSALHGNLSPTRIERLIKNAKDGKLKGGRGMFNDSKHLYLQIGNNGAQASWIYRYDGTHWGYRGQVRIGLGSYRVVDVELARVKANHLNVLMIDGDDPKTAHENALLDLDVAQGKAKTVNQVKREYIETLSGSHPAYVKQADNWLNLFLCDPIGEWPIQKVNQNVLLENCTKIKELWKSQNPTVQGALTHIKALFDMAIEADYYVGKNPAGKGLRKRLPKSGHVRRQNPYVRYSDLPRFIKQLRAYKDARLGHQNIRTTVSLAVEFVAWNGARPGEVREAEWKEIDFDRKVWTVPWQHLKNGKKHHADLERPLTEPMLAILKEMQNRYGGKPPRDAPVFPGKWTKDGKLNKANFNQFITEQLGWEYRVTNHGFRSTLKDFLSAKRVPDNYWKIQVDHSQSGSKSDKAYGGNLLEERREAMEQYAEFGSTPAPEPTVGGVINIADKRRSA